MWQTWLVLKVDAKDRRIDIPKIYFPGRFCPEEVQFCDKEMDY